MFGKKYIVLAILFLSPLLSLSGWEITSTYNLEWDTKTFYIDITAHRQSSDPSLPSARPAAEHAIERALPIICLNTAAEIPVDSRHTLGEIMEGDKSILAALRDLYLQAERSSSNFTKDLSGLEVRYSFSMFPDLAQPLILHNQAFMGEQRLDWEPTGPFTGILIYAKGQLPEYGKTGTTLLKPCLFPEMYDQDMNLLSAPYMVSPEILGDRGPVTYAYSLKDPRVRDIIGYYPMRIAADAVFGTRPTNPVIPSEWGDKIRSSRYIQTLISEGKVVLIIEDPSVSSSSSAGP